MSPQTATMLYILFGVVGAVVLVGFITNTVEWLFSNVKKLSEQFPAQPVDEASATDRGEHSFAVTRGPYSVEQGRGFFRAMGCLAWIVGGVWLAAAIGIGVAFATGGVPSATLWRVLMAAALFGWTIFFFVLAYRVLTASAWHRLVKWTADDEHLHVTPVTSIGAPNASISIPWAALDGLEHDPADIGWARAPAGSFWIHCATEMVERELLLRREMGLHATPADVARHGIDDDTILDAEDLSDSDIDSHLPGPASSARRGQPAQSWDDLDAQPPRRHDQHGDGPTR